MKVWITGSHKPFEFSDYTIISPFNGQNPLDINDILDDGECHNIQLDKVLRYVPYINISAYLKFAIKKLRIGGEIVIEDIDTNQVTEAYVNGAINLKTFNKLLFGGKEHAWDFYQSSTNLTEVLEIIKDNGLKIIHKRLPNLHFSITAKRVS